MSQAVRKYLYLLALEGQAADRVIFFYAADENEAQEIASDHEADHNANVETVDSTNTASEWLSSRC